MRIKTVGDCSMRLVLPYILQDGFEKAYPVLSTIDTNQHHGIKVRDEPTHEALERNNRRFDPELYIERNFGYGLEVLLQDRYPDAINEREEKGFKLEIVD